MASTYPGSLDSFDTIASDKKMSDSVGGRTHRQILNDLGDAIEAVQGELGTTPSGSYATVKARFEAIEANDAKVGNLLTEDQASVESAAAHSGLQCTVARSTAQAKHGSASLQITTGTDWTSLVIPDTQVSVQPGQTYTATVATGAAATPRSAQCDIAFYKADGSWLTTVTGTPVSNTASGWTVHTVTSVAPELAALAFVAGRINNDQVSGEVHFADCFGLWIGAGGEWMPPGFVIPGLGARPNPANTAQVQVWNAVTQTWITV